jgi:hypothetical protein
MRARHLMVKGGQDVVHPGVALAAGVDEQVGVLDLQDVLGRGLIGMALGAGRQQHGHVGGLAGHLTAEVEGGEIGGDDRGLFALRGQRGRAGHRGGQYDQGGQSRQYFSHDDSSMRLMGAEKRPESRAAQGGGINRSFGCSAQRGMRRRRQRRARPEGPAARRGRGGQRAVSATAPSA